MAEVEEEGKVKTKPEKEDEEEENESTPTEQEQEQVDKDKDSNVPAASATASTSESAPLEVSSLPEGCSVLVGEDGQQYVTVEQDGQTYAIPADEYQAVQSEGGGAIAIHQEGGDGAATAVVVQQQPQQQDQGPQQVQVVVTSPQPVAATEVKPVPAAAAEDGSAVAAASTAPVLMLQPVQPPPGILRARQLQMQKEQQLKQQQQQQLNKVPKKLRTINVENWGIFLLSRFQEYFHKKEHCDLTIRFPTRNAQLKTHSLVVHSCTDFFSEKAKEGAIKNGVIDMEEEFTPEAVAPIIQFMYTGRLSLPHQAAYERMRETAKRFNMSLLSKLIEDQLKDPAPAVKAKRGRKPKRAEDPISQMKKIQRIEKKFTQEEKKAKQQQFRDGLTAAQRSRVKLEEEFAGEDTVPGKKLPIWKKRTSLPAAAAAIAPPPTSTPVAEPAFISPDVPTPLQGPDDSLVMLTPVSGPPPGAKLIPVSGVPASSIIASPPPKVNFAGGSPGVVASRAYNRQGTGTDGPAKLPSKIRELQENLNFEKIRRTGVKNSKGVSASEWAEVAGSNDEVTKDMTVEEMREFMEEQRKRLNQLGEEDDDDYYDNDAGLPDDDYPEEDDIASPPPTEASPSRPILKQEKKSDDSPSTSVPRKSVRFSLRPGAVPTPQNIDASDKPAAEKPMSPPKKRGRPASTVESRTLLQETLDNTVDVFNQAVEEEEKNVKVTQETPQAKASPVVRRGRGRPPKKSPDPNSDPLTTPKSGRLVKNDSVTPPAKRRRVTAPKENGSPFGSASNHSKLVMEVLKKNPDLFKNNKQVQLKVMAKDATGKAVMKYITLKAADKEGTSQTNTSRVSITSVKLRDVPKVKYLGSQGRPKHLKPGEPDPHAEERLQIEQKLNAASDANIMVVTESEMATLDQVGKTEVLSGVTLPDQSLDPSSEAEALSNVASGIAASLGVSPEAQQQQCVSISDLVVSDLPSVTQEQQVVYLSNGQPVQVLQTSPDGSSLVVAAPDGTSSPTVEAAMAKLHEGNSGANGSVAKQISSSDGDKKAKAISQIVDDWDDEDDI